MYAVAALKSIVPTTDELEEPLIPLAEEIAFTLFNLTTGVLELPEVPPIETLPTAALLLPDTILVPFRNVVVPV